MRSSSIPKSALLALWLTALVGIYLLASRLGYALVPCGDACSCKNTTVYEAVGAAPAGPTWWFKSNGDGTFSLTTQAVAACFTGNSCDDPNPTQTTSKVYPVVGPAPATCNLVAIPVGQTVYLEV